MGASVVVMHPGGKVGDDRSAALRRAVEHLGELLDLAEKEGLTGIAVAPETMGKPAQLGNLDEVLELCRVSEHVVPAVDFGHLHAAGGGALKDTAAIAKVLDRIQGALGEDSLANLHIHFSQIEFTGAGERRHRTALDEGFGPDFALLAQEIIRRKITPTIICESAGRQAEDALLYRQIYKDMLRLNSPE